MITINEDKCIKCGSCVKSCIASLFFQKEKKSAPQIPYPEYCILCGHCVSVCPKAAITHGSLKMENFHDVKQILPEDLENFLASKRSIRNFSSKEVTRDVINKIITVSCFAPSDQNSQSVSYTAVSNSDLIQKTEDTIIDGYKTWLSQNKDIDPKENPQFAFELNYAAKIIKMHADNKHPIFKNAPWVITLQSDKNSVFGKHNCLEAEAYLMLQAHSYGVGSCIVGRALYDTTVIEKLFEIEESQTVSSVIMLGYPKLKYKRTVDIKAANINWK